MIDFETRMQNAVTNQLGSLVLQNIEMGVRVDLLSAQLAQMQADAPEVQKVHAEAEPERESFADKMRVAQPEGEAEASAPVMPLAGESA